MEVKKGDKVRVHYTGRLTDGTVFDSSIGSDPVEFTTGQRSIIPGFENGVLGMAPGQKKTIRVPATEAYGPYYEERVLCVKREQFPSDIQPRIGQQLQVGNEEQATVVTVTEVDEQNVTLDANHPLAGQDLIFDIELVDIVSD